MKTRLLRSGYIGGLAVLFLFYSSAHGAPVTTCDEASLRAAISAGGTIIFDCDGLIVLSSPIVVTNSVSLDANGHSITISGDGAVRLFNVLPGVSFNASGIALIGGFAETGGAILNDAGFVTLTNCSLLNNAAVGTNGTMFLGGAAAGGAIFSRGGTINATSCLFSNNVARGGKGGAFHPFPGGGCGGSAHGGAIYDSNGNATFSNCQFVVNAAVGGGGGDSPVTSGGCGGSAWGGAIVSSNGALVVMGTLFDSNTVSGGEKGNGSLGIAGAGGSAVGGSIVTLAAAFEPRNSTFIRNTAQGGSGGRGSSGGSASGGAVYADGTSDIDGCIFMNNFARAAFGRPEGPSADALGGALVIVGQGSAARAIFATNAVGGAPAGNRQSVPAGSGKGGALYNTGTFHVSQSAFLWNTASGGNGARREGAGSVFVQGGDAAGGAINNAGSLMLTNVTIGFNTAIGGEGAPADLVSPAGPPGHGLGGALYNTGAAEFGNSTLVHNTGTGGVIHALAPVGMVNSIVAYPQGGANCAGQINDHGHNIGSDNSCSLSAPGSLDNTDPRVGAIGHHGGSTPTAPLLVGSPAIDSANLSSCPAGDQRGTSRPQGMGCDIGAFEAQQAELRPVLRVEREGDNLRVHVLGRPGTAYRLLASGAFTGWTSIATNTTDGFGHAMFQQSCDTPENFYRVTTP